MAKGKVNGRRGKWLMEGEESSKRKERKVAERDLIKGLKFIKKSE